MFRVGKKSTLDAESEDWLITGWTWLLENLADLETFRGFPFVLPTADYFPSTKKTGHEKAQYIFEFVTKLSGTADWPIDLVPQTDDFDPVLAPLVIVKNVQSDPLGTFSVQSGQRLKISYDIRLLDRPIDLIATFIHEISHAVLLGIEEEVPGGPEFEEIMTDLATVFLGFGIFGANSAFTFQQHSDVGSGTQGWSYSHSGYLNEAEWAFSLAVFLYLRGDDPKNAGNWLKPTPKSLLKKSMRYLNQHPERLSPLCRKGN